MRRGVGAYLRSFRRQAESAGNDRMLGRVDMELFYAWHTNSGTRATEWPYLPIIFRPLMPLIATENATMTPPEF